MGLVTALAAESDLEVVGEAGDGEACLALLRTLTPDILLLDLALPRIDGYEVLRWARIHRPALRTIVLSMYAEQAFAERARELGAAAFIAKEDALCEVQAALHSSADRFYASASLARNPIFGMAGVPDRGPAGGDGAAAATTDSRNSDPSGFGARLLALSPTERLVMGLLARSLTSREIASRLEISPRTVQTHRAHIVDKLGVRGSNRLLELAIRYRRIFP